MFCALAWCYACVLVVFGSSSNRAAAASGAGHTAVPFPSFPFLPSLSSAWRNTRRRRRRSSKDNPHPPSVRPARPVGWSRGRARERRGQWLQRQLHSGQRRQPTQRRRRNTNARGMTRQRVGCVETHVLSKVSRALMLCVSCPLRLCASPVRSLRSALLCSALSL
jgi:hypothetical protein